MTPSAQISGTFAEGGAIDAEDSAVVDTDNRGPGKLNGEIQDRLQVAWIDPDSLSKGSSQGSLGSAHDPSNKPTQTTSDTKKLPFRQLIARSRFSIIAQQNRIGKAKAAKLRVTA
jgi:hypothetical protein